MNWKEDREFVAWQQDYVQHIGHWIVPFIPRLYEAWKAAKESNADV